MKVAMLLSYDGYDYLGFQRQLKQPSVQQTVEEALSRMHQEEVSIVGAGRTDAGVHAAGQVIHFNTPLTIPVRQWPYALNSMLPTDIRVLRASIVEGSFHARYSAIGKRYLYRIDRRPIPSVFTRRYAYHYPYPLDLEGMRLAALQLTGQHDFTSFSASGSAARSRIRTIHEIKIAEEGQELLIFLRGDGFLYNMVRIIVGTLLEVGGGRRKAEETLKLIEAMDRTKAGPTAPAHGLCLQEVFYPWQIFSGLGDEHPAHGV